MQTRRHFLHQLELLTGGIACASLPGLLSGCAARMRYATPTVIGDRLGVPIADVTANGVLVEDPSADLPIYLRRSAEGAFTAVSTRCMHRGCQVEPAAAKLVCPCHGSEYDFAGAVLQGPTERPLTRYRVTSDPTMVFIHVQPVRQP